MISCHGSGYPIYVIALKIAFQPFALSLSKGERSVRGELVEPWTGLYTPLCEIIFSYFVVLIAISMADSRARGTQNDISGKSPKNYLRRGLTSLVKSGKSSTVR